MTMRSRASSLLLLLLAAGCTYRAQPSVRPAFDIPASFEERVPGAFALAVEVSDLPESARVMGLSCAAHTYRLELAEPLRLSVVRTFEPLVERLVVVEGGLSRAALERRGLDGLIRVEMEEVDARLRIVSGFLSADAEAEVSLAATLTVDGRKGRLLGTTLGVEAEATSEVAGLCAGPEKAVAAAAEKAIKKLVRRLGERFASSERLRRSLQEGEQRSM